MWERKCFLQLNKICTHPNFGWAFSLRFVKQSRLEYQDIVNSMDMSRAVNKDDWTFVPSTNNKNEWIWRNNNTVVVIHQESWLWFG